MPVPASARDGGICQAVVLVVPVQMPGPAMSNPPLLQPQPDVDTVPAAPGKALPI